MINMSRSRIITIVIVGIVVLLTWWCILFVTRIGKIAVDVQTSPQNTKIEIDGKRAHTGTNYLSVGSHTFTASKEGYSTAKQTVKIDSVNNYVALLPEPESAEAVKEASSSKESSRAQTISGIASSRSGEAFNVKNPIVGKLPYSDISGPFKIDFGYNQDDNDKVYLIVSYTSPNGRIKAINWLRRNKVDITLTEIIFQDFINPAQVEEHTHE